MDDLFFILPLLFVLVGYMAEYWEFYIFAAVIGFYTSITLILTASPLTDQIVLLGVVYLMFSVGISLRLLAEYVQMGERKKGGR